MDVDNEILSVLKEIRDLLSSSPRAASEARRATKAKTTKGDVSPERSQGDAPVDQLLASKEDASEWHAIWESRKPIDKWLAILAVAEEEVAPKTPLSAPEIAQIATDRFRLSGVHASNVNRDLKRERKYVSRAKRGTRFEYWLTRDGLNYISKRRDERASPGREDGVAPRAVRWPNKTRAAKREGAKTSGRPVPRSRARAASGGRPGPKAMLEDLISKGYFKSARTITEVQGHLQQHRGHRYKATDLSPALIRLVRDGTLSRDTNADGTYEYQAD
jgi:hypothetical protein